MVSYVFDLLVRLSEVSRELGCPCCDGLPVTLGRKVYGAGKTTPRISKGAGGQTERRATPRKTPVKCWSII